MRFNSKIARGGSSIRCGGEEVNEGADLERIVQALESKIFGYKGYLNSQRLSYGS